MVNKAFEKNSNKIINFVWRGRLSPHARTVWPSLMHRLVNQ